VCAPRAPRDRPAVCEPRGDARDQTRARERDERVDDDAATRDARTNADERRDARRRATTRGDASGDATTTRRRD